VWEWDVQKEHKLDKSVSWPCQTNLIKKIIKLNSISINWLDVGMRRSKWTQIRDMTTNSIAQKHETI
jgi:hypothetical protein